MIYMMRVQREVSKGLRVQFTTRSEWIGLLVGKAGARIRDARKSTGCSIEVCSGNSSGGLGGGSRGRGRGGYGSGGIAANRLPPTLPPPCKVVISGPDADSVQRAREEMELVEARIPVDSHQVRWREEESEC